MNWKDTISKEKGRCEINLCHATTCRYNENNQCTLVDVNVDNEGKCEQFSINRDTGTDRALRQHDFEQDNM
tara:strand:- start:110 stop:322 length:213 start_codon:yes stop_codon:yes gene_type:complete